VFLTGDSLFTSNSDLMFETQNKYIRFLANGLLFFALVFLVDLIVGNTLHQLYFKQTSGENYALTYSIDSSYADVVILGSSHAKHHYVPSVIEDTLGLSCYNQGSGGQNIYYHYGILGSLLERYTPRIVILDLVTIDYRITEEEYNTDRLSVLLPYYKRHKAIREIIDLRGSFEKVRLLSKIYPFNSQITHILFSYIRNENKADVLINGYSPLYGEISNSQQVEQIGVRFKIDSLKISYIKKIITKCEQNEVRLIIINSPSIVNSKGESMSFDVIEKIGTELDVEVWNYENEKQFLRSEYLHDAYHLNDSGARQFTMAIASRLKREEPEDILGTSEISKENCRKSNVTINRSQDPDTMF
jgi:hypothetical protein